MHGNSCGVRVVLLKRNRCSRCWRLCGGLQVLLQLYEPLVMSRAKRVQAPHADLRDLLVVARQGVLRAAASFDSQRAAKGGDKGRLAALAEMYIRNALRDVLQEVSGAVWCTE